MERITARRPWGEAFLPIRRDHIDSPPYEAPNWTAVKRLAVIEDILGDNYDLDQLRGLMTAEREGRLHIAPLKPGDSVYWLLEDEGEYYVTPPEKVDEVGFNGFFTKQLIDGPIDGNVNYIEWGELGESVFLSREEAEAALEKMKEENEP